MIKIKIRGINCAIPCPLMKEELYEILSSHSGKSMEQIEADADRDYWMKADAAKEYGLIDEVLRREKK